MPKAYHRFRLINLGEFFSFQGLKNYFFKVSKILYLLVR